MEPDDIEKIEAKFTKLAEEVNAILDRIKRREAKEASRRMRDIYSAPKPRNIYKQLPGRQGFVYIKVPKIPSDLSFGSKMDRAVFPDIPGVIVKNGHIQHLHSKKSRKKVCKFTKQLIPEPELKKSLRFESNNNSAQDSQSSENQMDSDIESIFIEGF